MNESKNMAFLDSDDSWDDIDFSDLVDTPMTDSESDEPATAASESQESTDAEAEANPAEDSAAGGADSTEASQNEASTDQYFDLKVLGEERRLTRDEMIAAAQKGLDYDRVKSRNAELMKERDENAASINLVKELAEAQGISTSELIMNVRAAALARKENISISAATERIKLQDRENAVAKREEAFKEKDDADKAEAEERAARNKEFVKFFQAHPDVKPEEIPKQCFVDMKNGIPLETSYKSQMFAKKNEESTKALSEKDKRIKELEDKIAELDRRSASQNQNQLNAARSVGSVDTAGKGSKDDAFDRAWYDGT